MSVIFMIARKEIYAVVKSMISIRCRSAFLSFNTLLFRGLITRWLMLEESVPGVVSELLDPMLGEVLDLALVVLLSLKSNIRCILVRSWSSNFFISDAIVSVIFCFTDCSRVTVINSGAGGSVYSIE